MAKEWREEAFRTIEVDAENAGAAATDSDLISWLQANAVQTRGGHRVDITLYHCFCDRQPGRILGEDFEANITAAPGYYLDSNSIVVNATGTISVSVQLTDPKHATVSITNINSDLQIIATGVATTKKIIKIHPNHNGVTDFNTTLYPVLNEASSDDIYSIFGETWVDPIQDGDTLVLNQVYSATQNGDTLIIE